MVVEWLNCVCWTLKDFSDFEQNLIWSWYICNNWNMQGFSKHIYATLKTWNEERIWCQKKFEAVFVSDKDWITMDLMV